MREKFHSEAKSVYISIETPGSKAHLLAMQVFHSVLQQSDGENITLPDSL